MRITVYLNFEVEVGRKWKTKIEGAWEVARMSGL